ncbi:prepilin peptidase [Selenomonas bovis]|uniref:Prepilin peptidase n=1 Tax=Selenomonas bovis TaxID=416586 RepID=A0A848BBC3_9FIRM|nr:A24 family peptidase [Selenomonas bovis]NMD99205.1 prepilin peptidase [Selenomonas bovis]
MIFSLLAAEASALLAGVLGARWVNDLYAANPDIMSFPDQVPRQQQRHARLLCGLLSLLFCYTVLTMRAADAVHLAFLLFFEFFLLVYTLTDFEQQVIFDRMLVPFAAAALVSLPLLGRDIPDHLIAGAAGFAVFLVLAVVTRGGIGGGDIKLIAALGLWLGTDQLLTVACTGMILGGVAALLLLVTKRRKRGEMFAYGPYFTVAALVLALI